MYALADRLHKTVDELLYGELRPIRGRELARWMAFTRRRDPDLRRRRQEAAAEAAREEKEWLQTRT